jgi:hypothetical protein
MWGPSGFSGGFAYEAARHIARSRGRDVHIVDSEHEAGALLGEDDGHSAREADGDVEMKEAPR